MCNRAAWDFSARDLGGSDLVGVWPVNAAQILAQVTALVTLPVHSKTSIGGDS